MRTCCLLLVLLLTIAPGKAGDAGVEYDYRYDNKTAGSLAGRPEAIADAVNCIRQGRYELLTTARTNAAKEIFLRGELVAPGYLGLSAVFELSAPLLDRENSASDSTRRREPIADTKPLYRAWFNTVMVNYLRRHPESGGEQFAEFIRGLPEVFPLDELLSARLEAGDADFFPRGGNPAVSPDVEVEVCRFQQGSKWGYIDTRGEIVIPPVLYWARDFYPEKVAAISIGGEAGLINGRGEVLIEPVHGYVDIFPLHGGRCFALRRDGTQLVMTNTGDELFELGQEWDFYYPLPRGDMIWGCKNRVWGYYRPDGEPVASGFFARYGFWSYPSAAAVGNASRLVHLYEEFSPISRQGVAAVAEEGKYFIVDAAGEKIGGVPYDFLGMFSPKGLAAMRRGDVSGYVRSNGEEAFTLPPGYEALGCVAVNGLAKVGYKDPETEKTRFGFVNELGEIAIEPQYEYAADFSAGGLAPVGIDGKQGAIDAEGNMVAPPIYSCLGSDVYLPFLIARKPAAYEQPSSQRRYTNFCFSSGALDTTGQYFGAYVKYRNGLIYKAIDGRREYWNAAGELVFQITEKTEQPGGQGEHEYYSRRREAAIRGVSSRILKVPAVLVWRLYGRHNPYFWYD